MFDSARPLNWKNVTRGGSVCQDLIIEYKGEERHVGRLVDYNPDDLDFREDVTVGTAGLVRQDNKLIGRLFPKR